MADSTNVGQGPLLIGVTWILTSIATLSIVARFYVRSKVLKSLGSDDWFMLASGVLQIANQACITTGYENGFGKRDVDLAIPQVIEILKWTWISATPGILVSILARISITILIVKIFGKHKWLKWYLIGFTALQSIVGLLLIIICWVQVQPVQGLWNPTIPAKRWNPAIQQNLAYATQGLFTFSDLTYVLFPVLIIWRLNMSWNRRLGLCLLMSLSLFTMAASLMKSITAQSNATSVYVASTAVLWSVVEQTLVITMDCIPPLRPFPKVLNAYFQKISSSLSTLIGSSSNISRSMFTRTQSHDSQDKFHDSERADTVHKFRDNIVLLDPRQQSVSVAHKAQDGNAHAFQNSRSIQRTDDIAVTYA